MSKSLNNSDHPTEFDHPENTPERAETPWRQQLARINKNNNNNNIFHTKIEVA